MKTTLRITLPALLALSMLLIPFSRVIAAAAIVSPSIDSRSGLVGSTVAYTLTVDITDYTADFTLSATVTSASGWTACIAPANVTITGNGSYAFVVNVAIPASPTVTTDLEQVSFTDGTSTLATALLTTTAIITAPTPTTYSRPIVVVESYNSSVSYITPGEEFNLKLTLRNRGGSRATNIVVSFEGDSFLPRETGGVIAVTGLNSGSGVEVSQRMWANPSLIGQQVGTLGVKMSYNDGTGAAYSESFTLVINLALPQSMWAGYPTSTPTAIMRPQLVVNAYRSDVDPLQPGSTFNLTLEIQNLGNSAARSVSMVLGGGASADSSGTPSPGGVSTSGADLTTFAPLGSSNVVFLGDIEVNAINKPSAQLIVNTTANPGAYTFKLSFIYDGPGGTRLVNDQAITLLVYALPQLEVNFYRSPDPFFANSEGILPLQVTNLGRKSSVLGNMTVTASNADVFNNTALVGALDPGGYFTLDASLMPYQEGPLEVTVTINYTDDFNQARQVVQTLNVDVLPMQEEMFPPEGMDGEVIVDENANAPQDFGDILLRVIKALLGLDSSAPKMIIPAEMEPESVPVMPRGGKGG